MEVKIFVEGIADKKFLTDFIDFHYNIPVSDDEIIMAGGYGTLSAGAEEGEMFRNKA